MAFDDIREIRYSDILEMRRRRKREKLYANYQNSEKLQQDFLTELAETLTESEQLVPFTRHEIYQLACNLAAQEELSPYTPHFLKIAADHGSSASAFAYCEMLFKLDAEGPDARTQLQKYTGKAAFTLKPGIDEEKEFALACFYEKCGNYLQARKWLDHAKETHLKSQGAQCDQYQEKAQNIDKAIETIAAAEINRMLDAKQPETIALAKAIARALLDISKLDCVIETTGIPTKTILLAQILALNIVTHTLNKIGIKESYTGSVTLKSGQEPISYQQRWRYNKGFEISSTPFLFRDVKQSGTTRHGWPIKIISQ